MTGGGKGGDTAKTRIINFRNFETVFVPYGNGRDMFVQLMQFLQ